MIGLSKPPLVSVVTPSFNQGEFIEDNLLSVLKQDYPVAEHIVVDGGSADETVDILQKYEARYKLRWVSEPDSGQTDALLKGFTMARGEIIGWLNSDDMYFDRSALSFVVSQFRKDPATDILYGDDIAVDENNRILRVRRIFDWKYTKLLQGLSISQPAAFLSRYVVRDNNLDRSLHHAMDLEFWLRLGKRYRFRHVKRILAAFRIHKRAKSTALRDTAKAEAKRVLAAYGQDFGIRYYLLRYLSNLPGLVLRRVLGLRECLTILNDLDRLAFRPQKMSILSLLISQLWPFV